MSLQFLWRLLKEPSRESTVIVIPEDRVHDPDQYLVRPRYLVVTVVSVLFLATVGSLLFGALSPLGDWIRGRDVEAMREQAIHNAIRIGELEDSLQAQETYATLIAELVGVLDDESESGSAGDDEGYVEEELPVFTSLSPDWSDHEQPAVPMSRLPAIPVPVVNVGVNRDVVTGFPLPFLPPVEGFITREFDSRRGHFAVDIAVEPGTPVRAVGDGHAVFADWGYDGGWTIVIHHAEGYVSVYKHNDRLLKGVGDRVLDREAVAISGNSGEITSGPHIHFELWHEGLAQDPQRYFLQ